MTTLGFERGTANIAHQIELARTVERLIAIAGTISAPDGRRKAIEDDSIAAQLATLRAEVAALRSMTALTISRNMRQAVPGPEGNLVALQFGELIRTVFGFALELLGPAGLERDSDLGEWALDYLECYKWAIGGGTSEIRRNAIGERLLGMPRGPRA
jgi:alkylation response protein AidB-like acyl-CoA dehydrogenase